MPEDFLLHELLAAVVALVQVDGAYEGLEGVAVHVAVVRRGARGVFHQFVQPYFHGQLVQRLALHYLGAGVGEEAFAASLEVAVDDVAHNGVQDGVAQEFEPFVVQGAALFGAEEGGLVEQCLAVDADVAGKEAEYPVKTKIRLPVLAEQEPYLVYLVT